MYLRRHRSRGTGPGNRPARAAGKTGSADLLRLVRAGVFTAVCVVTTALGHALMSGDLLPWWALSLAFGAAGAGSWWLTGREHAAVPVVGATVVAQGLLHLMFSLAHQLVHASVAEVARAGHGVAFSHSGVAMRMDHSGMAMHRHHSGSSGAVRPSDAMGLSSAGSPLEPVVPHASSAGMLLAHLLAAVVCGVWLWRGEAAAHRIGRALTAALFAPLRRVCRGFLRTSLEGRAPSGRTAAGDTGFPRPASASLRHSVVRRGPPASRAAVLRRRPPDPPLALLT